MRNVILLLFVAMQFTINAQTNYFEGYFVDNDGNKTECLIKNKDWGNTPEFVLYKLNNEGEDIYLEVSEVKELKLYDTEHYYKRFSTADIEFDLSQATKVFNKDYLLLKILVEGETSLYAYNSNNLYIFYKLNDKIKFLNNDSNPNKIEKKYKKDFQKQLYEDLQCEGLKVSDFISVKYRETALANLFKLYNECKNYEFASYNELRTKAKWHIKGAFGTVFSPSLKSTYAYFYSIPNAPSAGGGSTSNKKERSFDFGGTTNLAFGLELEVQLPFNNNKWSLFANPTYQSISNKESSDSFSDPLFIDFTSNINLSYSFIELPIGLRRYFYLNNKDFKAFVQLAYHYNMTLNSDIEQDFNAESSVLENFSYELSSKGLNNESKNTGFSLGFGGTYKDNLALTFKYYLFNNITIDDNNRMNNNSAISLQITYSI